MEAETVIDLVLPKSRQIDVKVIDGIKHCTVCKMPVERQRKWLDGTLRMIPCMCKCQLDEREAQERKLDREEKQRNRSICFSDSKMYQWTFANDDMANEKIHNGLVKYTDNFEKYLQENKGLLFYGSVGTGKSYYAGCVCNELIEKGYRCKMTNFATIVNQLSNSFEGRNEYINQLCSYSLLVIDDLGAERQSDYMKEQVFNIINARYVSGKPIVVTTNLLLNNLMSESDISYKRIYDRLLECTIPVEINGISRRKRNFIDNTKELDFLGMI